MSDLVDLTWGDSRWAGPALIAAILISLLCIATYRRIGHQRRLRWAACALKVIAVAMICVLFVDPLWSRLQPLVGANTVAVLIDGSHSQNLPFDDRWTRAELARNLLNPETDWRTKLDQTFLVEQYQFAEGVDRVEGPDDLTFQGRQTRLVNALSRVANRPRRQTLAAIVLLTDGQDRAANWLQRVDCDRLPPVYVVEAKTAARHQDVAVRAVSVGQSAFEDSPLTLKVGLQAIGIEDETVNLCVTTPDGRDVHTEPVLLESGRTVHRIQLPASVRQVPLVRVSVRGAAAEEDVAAENNHFWVRLPAAEREYRVLYVGGRPNWEYKFLRRALEGDSQVELTALIRIAKREARFRFRGHRDESTNPLFRGFEADAAETLEQYDEPVVMRLNTRSDEELASGFPRTADELFQFDAVILDDLEAGFLKVEQQELLQRFVTERGGATLFLGGTESFTEGGFRDSVLADLLPVHLLRNSAAPPTVHNLRLTPDGWLEPWVRLDKDKSIERKLRAKVPPFQVLNQVGAIKPAARTMAVAVSAEGSERPSLIVQQFGRGRTAALTIGDLWRWRMHADEGRAPERVWRQLVRWLVSDVPAQLWVDTDPARTRQGTRKLRIHTRTSAFEPDSLATVRVKVTAPDGTHSESQAIPALDVPGVYEVEVVADQDGLYQATAAVESVEEQLPPRVLSTQWYEDALGDELRDSRVDRIALMRLAEATGGRVVAPDQLTAFVDDLESQELPAMQRTFQSAWHNGYMLCGLLCCLVGEWTLRRRMGQA